MAKICLKEDCDNPVFSNLYCKWHQYMRKDKKFTSISKTSNRVKKKATGEKVVFDLIYEENKNNWVSSISGDPLVPRGHYFFYWQFAHIIPKGKSDKLRLMKSNIMIMTKEEHSLVDHGTIEQRSNYEKLKNCSFDIFYLKQEQLKNKYL